MCKFYTLFDVFRDFPSGRKRDSIACSGKRVKQLEIERGIRMRKYAEYYIQGMFSAVSYLFRISISKKNSKFRLWK